MLEANANDGHEIICHEEIHFPSEDYPCLCDELFVDETGTICLQCGHGVAKHAVNRTPSSSA